MKKAKAKSMKFTKVITSSLVCLLLASCSTTSSSPTINKESTTIYFLTDESGNILYDEDNVPLTPLNTYVSITTTNSSLKDDMVNEFTSLVRKYHYELDSHHNFEGINNLKTINDNYGVGPVAVDKDIIEILKEAIKIAKESDGYFNPTIGALSDVWSSKYNNQEGQSDPSTQDIENAKACVISNDKLDEYIEIDETNSTVYLKKYEGCSSKVELSLGAISKGYALDKIYDELLKYDSGFLITAGGSSSATYVADNQKDSLTWKIGIIDPDNTSNTYSVIEVGTSFISTSGDYQQFFINDEGIRRHHILNPYTGYPENKYRSITLVAQDNGTVLDALSTTLFSTDDIDKYLDTFTKDYDLDIKAYILADENGKAEPIYNTLDTLLIN